MADCALQDQGQRVGEKGDVRWEAGDGHRSGWEGGPRCPAQHPGLPGSSPSLCPPFLLIHPSIHPSIAQEMVLRVGYGPGQVLGSGCVCGGNRAACLALRNGGLGMGVRQQPEAFSAGTWAPKVGAACEVGDRGACWALGSGKGCLSREEKLGQERTKEGTEVGARQTEPAEGGLPGDAWRGARRGAGGHAAPAGPRSGSAQSSRSAPWSLLPVHLLATRARLGTLFPSPRWPRVSPRRGPAGPALEGPEGECWACFGSPPGSASRAETGTGQRAVQGGGGSEGQAPGGTGPAVWGPANREGTPPPSRAGAQASGGGCRCCGRCWEGPPAGGSRWAAWTALCLIKTGMRAGLGGAGRGALPALILRSSSVEQPPPPLPLLPGFILGIRSQQI